MWMIYIHLITCCQIIQVYTGSFLKTDAASFYKSYYSPLKKNATLRELWSCAVPEGPPYPYIFETDIFLQVGAKVAHESSISYRCPYGQKQATGSSTWDTCWKGKWTERSLTQPDCVEEDKVCGQPRIPYADMSHIRQGYPIGYRKLVTCIEGAAAKYREPMYITCLDGEWSSGEESDLLCEPAANVFETTSVGTQQDKRSCVVPELINARTTMTSSVVRHGESTTFMCRLGFALPGGFRQATMTCYNGMWTSPHGIHCTENTDLSPVLRSMIAAQTSQPMTLPPKQLSSMMPPGHCILPHGYRDNLILYNGERYQVTCKRGLLLSGSSTVFCRNGLITFPGGVPLCSKNRGEPNPTHMSGAK